MSYNAPMTQPEELVAGDRAELQKPLYIPALDAAALPPGKGETVLLAGRRVAVFNVAGQFYALDDDCPHRGGPLGSGWVDADACHVTCPLHGWAFDLKTGAGVTVPARPVRSYTVRVVEGKVEVSVQLAVSSIQSSAGLRRSGIEVVSRH